MSIGSTGPKRWDLMALAKLDWWTDAVPGTGVCAPVSYRGNETLIASKTMKNELLTLSRTCSGNTFDVERLGGRRPSGNAKGASKAKPRNEPNCPS